jgi:hypothetical protein
MAREIAWLGQWVPALGALMIGAIYVAFWYFALRRPLHPDLRPFASFVLFFIPALTFQDALGDASLVYTGVPLLSIQGIQVSAAIYGLVFVFTQWRAKAKRKAGSSVETSAETKVF